MRQRRVKNLDEKIRALDKYIADWNTVDSGSFACGSTDITGSVNENRGHWRELFQAGEIKADTPLFLEIGCGKGRFIAEHAEKNPDQYFLAIEGHESVVLRALEKAEEKQLENVKYILRYIRDLKDFFAENELDGIYLNFSDPWPKERHASRRLTYRGFLEMYRYVVKPGGFIAFKTDNEGLFEFSLEEIEALGMNVSAFTRDLHNSEYADEQVITEYEQRFIDAGKNINYIKLTV